LSELNLASLKDAILQMKDVEEVKKCVNDELKSGLEPIKIVNELTETLLKVGEKYENGEYFLSELMMAGILATEVINLLEPYLANDQESETKMKIVIGTVKGDIHDIGKNIVIMMLRAVGFKVLDLGVDVSVENFMNSIRNERPKVLGMSALLTSTINEMKNVIDALKNEGLRESIKIIIGGRPVSEEFAQEIGADGYGRDSVDAIKIVKNFIG
jgi:methylmalonyl-CoA mutase cobalamin-binding domain/chain